MMDSDRRGWSYPIVLIIVTLGVVALMSWGLSGCSNKVDANPVVVETKSVVSASGPVEISSADAVATSGIEIPDPEEEEVELPVRGVCYSGDRIIWDGKAREIRENLPTWTDFVDVGTGKGLQITGGSWVCIWEKN